MTYRIPTREMVFMHRREEARLLALRYASERIAHLSWLVERLAEDKRHLREMCHNCERCAAQGE